MNDTSPEIERMVRERFRAMAPEERFAIGCQMFETARAIVLSSFPAGLTRAQVRWRLCERFYGARLAQEAYGPYPDATEPASCNDAKGHTSSRSPISGRPPSGFLSSPSRDRPGS